MQKLQLPDNLKSAIKDMCEKFGNQGVKTINLEFSGGGDSGQIEDIDTHPVAASEPGDYDSEAIRAMGYGILERWGIDWYNNEGGAGTIIIHTSPARVEIDGGPYVTTLENSPAEAKL